MQLPYSEGGSDADLTIPRNTELRIQQKVGANIAAAGEELCVCVCAVSSGVASCTLPWCITSPLPSSGGWWSIKEGDGGDGRNSSIACPSLVYVARCPHPSAQTTLVPCVCVFEGEWVSVYTKSSVVIRVLRAEISVYLIRGREDGPRQACAHSR